ncbi:SMC5-SMC6 complex localization factor protein 2 isoform X1 [Larimichthys crocea]|uniref:SMC5-SMC6 complex localization factor protein 2 isoform X1 n=2 Tax=Larimichthys crocea TaxID=215358 RepID=UPI000F5D541E|nr:SMC5-SMC6 complex localization factor protein 2-like isoform X1 [Larimichthys crocea]
MKRATENQGNTRSLSDYFSPRSKAKDHALQQRPLPHFASFLQETPMKPSQVPNQLPYPPPRRMLPLQSPELCHRDRLGPPRQPPHHLGPIHSAGFVPSSPTNTGPSVNRLHPTPRDKLGSLHHSAQPPGSYCSRLASVNPTNSGPTANKLQSSHSLSSHIRRDQVPESKVTLSYSGSKHVTAQRQESYKVQSSDVRSATPTVQLHRPPVTSPYNPRAAQEVCPLPHSDSVHWSPGNNQWPLRGYQPSPNNQSDRSVSSSLTTMHSAVAPCQDQQHKQTPSSEKLIPAVDLNSQKRHMEFEDCKNTAKKLCLQSANSGKAQTPNLTVGNSLCTSLVSQPSSGNSSGLELSPKTTNSQLCTEPAFGQSTYLELSSTFKPTLSSCASPKPCLKRQSSVGASDKQPYLNSSQNQTMKVIELKLSPKPGEESLKKRSEEKDKSSSLLSTEVPQKDTGSAPDFQLGSSLSGHPHRSPPGLQLKTPSKGNQEEESRKSDSRTPKPVSKSHSGCRTGERNKTARSRRPVTIPDDIDALFTPDPMTFVVSHGQKVPKPRIDVATSKAHTSEKSSSSTVSSSSTTVTGSLCRKTQNSVVTGSPHVADTKVAPPSQVSMPTVALERVKLENLRTFFPKDSELKNSPNTSSGRQLKDESVKSHDKHTSLLPNNVRPCTIETTNAAASERTSTLHCSQSPLLERQASEGSRKQVNEVDPIDVELDLGLSFALDLDLTQSSQSSEEEQLLSLQEMMERVTKPPDTPEKGAFSEPSTPGHHSSQSKTLPLPSNTKTGIYKNNLDQMLKEINNNKKAKEIEIQLLTACKEDLLRIAEYEEAEENREEGISSEHQEFLQRYSLMSSAIREVPPGEVVFNLEKFGRIFNQNTLQLRQCMVNPQGTAQKTLLWSSPAQLRLHVNIGLFQEAYDCRSPCPTQVTRFLFKMMSVHNERMVSEKLLQSLCDIACTAAYQIVKNGNQQFKVWVPSLADVSLVLMNMGVAFVTLFPFENLQPPFTEGDLLEDIYIKSESPSSNGEQSTFPEHNCNSILKYLSYCMDLCPRAYSDSELLLLLTVVGRVGLDTRLMLQSSVELYPLQYKIVNNIRDWSNMLPRICLALTDLTDDHHNMCLLVQLLPDNTRGKQLRRHLSLSMISKLLDGNCTYRPTEKEIRLSELRPYLPRMQPSTLLRGMLSSSSRGQKDRDDMTILDQQSYYLCYSLLTLANEASNFQFFPAHQKEQLLYMCSELETHVKCDIRESEKCLYRSKVKDLVARIYTKWQMLLQRTRPLHGKLYDYWKPLPVDTLTSSQEEQEIEVDNRVDEEGPVMVEDEEETSGTEANEALIISEENKDGDNMMDDKIDTVDNTKSEEMEGDDMMDDTNETEDTTELALGELSHETPEMEPQVHEESEAMEEQITAGNIEHNKAETENPNETREVCQREQVAACDSVS